MSTPGAAHALLPPPYSLSDENVIPTDPVPLYTPGVQQAASACLVAEADSSYRHLADRFVAQQYESRVASPLRRVAFAAGSLPWAPLTLGASLYVRGRTLVRNELLTAPQPFRLRKHAFARLDVVPSLAASASLVKQLQWSGVLGPSRSRPVLNVQDIEPTLCRLRHNGKTLSLHQQGEIKTILLLQQQLTTHHEYLKVARQSMITSAMRQHGRRWREAMLPEFGNQPVGRLMRHFEMLQMRQPSVDELLHFDLMALQQCSEACQRRHPGASY